MSGGSSSSSSSSSQSTQQVDRRIGATDSAIVLSSEGGGISPSVALSSTTYTTSTDYGAIDAAARQVAAALGLSDSALATNKAVAHDAFGLAATAVDSASNLAVRAAETGNEAVKRALDFVDTFSQSEDQRTRGQVIGWAGAIAMAYIIAGGLRR